MIKERISKLLTIKSIVTLLLVTTYIFLLIAGKNVDVDFKNLVLMILSFYFGTQATKQVKGGNE